MGAMKVAVIGCGSSGGNLIRNFVDLSSSHLVAVADLRAERLAYVKSRYPGAK